MNLSNIDIYDYQSRILFQRSALEYSLTSIAMHISNLENQKLSTISLIDFKNPMLAASKLYKKASKAVGNYLNSWFIDELPINKKGLAELQEIYDKCFKLLDSSDKNHNHLDFAEDLLQKHGLWHPPNCQTLSRVFKEHDVPQGVISRLKEEWIFNSQKTLMSLRKEQNPVVPLRHAAKKIAINLLIAGGLAGAGAFIFGISGASTGLVALGLTALKGFFIDLEKEKGLTENFKIGVKSVYDYIHSKQGIKETSDIFDNLMSTIRKPPTTKVRRKLLHQALDQLNLYHDVMCENKMYLFRRENLVPFLSKIIKLEVAKEENYKLQKTSHANDSQFFRRKDIAKKIGLDGDNNNEQAYFFSHFNRLLRSQRAKLHRRRQDNLMSNQSHKKGLGI